VRSIDDLRGLVLAVQDGNTSQPVAQHLKDEGRVGDVRVYAYHDMTAMLDDLEAGRIGAIMKLAPVMHWFVRDRPHLRRAALDWFRAWEGRRDAPWTIRAQTIKGGTHAADVANVYRAALLWLYPRPTSPPDPRGFPVKVVLIIDQTGSMCVSAPPGSQGGQGYCEQAAVQAIIPPGVTRPARVRALDKLIQQFSAQPNVEVAVQLEVPVGIGSEPVVVPAVQHDGVVVADALR
jgi:hypothetical protein